MAVESKIVYRSDASEVARDIKTLVRARTELQRLQGAGTGGAGSDKLGGRLQVIREQGAQRRFLQEQRIGAAREARRERAREQHASRMASLKKVELQNEARIAVVRARQQRSGGPRMASAMDTGSGAGLLDIAGGTMLGGFAKDAAMWAARTAFDAGKAMIDAQAFRESTTLAMKAYLGSAAAANSWFDRALALSIELKQNSFDTIEGMTRLRGAGFDDKSVDNLTRAFADIKRLSPDADLKSIAIRLAQIRATGKLQGDELNELANAWPAARDVIFKQMMRDTGKTMKELQEMQRAGKITPGMVEKALLGGVSALTRMPLGEFAKANADTVRGLWDQIMAIPSQMLLGLDKSQDMGLIKGIMKDIVEFFSASSASGKEARKVIGDLFTALIEGLTGKDLKGSGIKDTLTGIVEMMRESVPMVKEWAGNVRTMGQVLGFFVEAGGKVAGLLTAWMSFWGVDISAKTLALSYFLGPLYAVILAVNKLVTSLFGEAWTAGVNLVTGFIGGIASQIGAIPGVVWGMAKTAISSLKGALKEKSPSRITMKSGENFDRGLAGGIDKFAWLPEQAANDVAVSSAAQAHPTLGAATTINNASASNTFSPSYQSKIVVGAGASPEAVRAAAEMQAEEDARFEAQIDRWMTRKASEIAA